MITMINKCDNGLIDSQEYKIFHREWMHPLVPLAPLVQKTKKVMFCFTIKYHVTLWGKC